jgi:DNA-binding transcriptional regulator YiaG
MGGYSMSERTGFFIKGRQLLAEPHHYVASGLDNVFLLNGVSESMTDYGPMIHIENVNGLHRAIGLHIVEKSEPMTGREFRFLRKQMDMTQSELAEQLGVSEQTVANYEKGKTGDFGPADGWMRIHYLLSILPEETRLGVIKAVTEAHKKLPEVPRRQLVERWSENGLRAA